MRALPQFALSLATILLCAGVTAGADLESAQHAYQATALQDATALAEQGQAEAQVVLGRMYLTGRGVPKDPDTAFKWFKAAAVQGNADGAFLLGAMYLLPRSDIPEGLRWVRLAAEQGNQDAQLLLGQTYMEGLPGLPRDLPGNFDHGKPAVAFRPNCAFVLLLSLLNVRVNGVQGVLPEPRLDSLVTQRSPFVFRFITRSGTADRGLGQNQTAHHRCHREQCRPREQRVSFAAFCHKPSFSTLHLKRSLCAQNGSR